LLEQLEHPLLGERHLFGRLDDEGVAADDGERQEPERHHGRKIERGDGRGDPDRLPHHGAVDAGGDVLQAVAHEHRGRPAGDFDALDAAPHAPARLVQGLAVLGRDDAGQLLEVRFEERLVGEHRARPDGGGRLAPAREGLARGGDGGVQVAAGRERHLGDDAALRRVGHVEPRGRGRLDPAAADEVLEPRDVGACLDVERALDGRRGGGLGSERRIGHWGHLIYAKSGVTPKAGL
jgi:hypothetical protein